MSGTAYNTLYLQVRGESEAISRQVTIRLPIAQPEHLWQ